MEKTELKIQEVVLKIKPIQIGHGLTTYENILKNNFREVESCFIELGWPSDKESLWPTSLVSSPKDTSFASSTEEFLTSLFRNPCLQRTNLKKIGLSEDFELKSKFDEIPFLALDGYLATVMSYVGWYGQNYSDLTELKKVGLEIINETFGSPSYHYKCFFNDFQIWSDNFDSWDVMFSFIVLNNKNKTITILHTHGQQAE